MTATGQGASVQEGADNARMPYMFPLMLNVTGIPIMLIGGGEISVRLSMLEEHGASNISIFSPDADEKLKESAGQRLEARWPSSEDFSRICPQLVFISDVEDGLAAEFRTEAKKRGALVHVQDRIPLCDFHLPARVRRGHLQVTVSTDGTVAGLSRILREYLEKDVFGPDWAARVQELAEARRKWKAEGLSFSALSQAIRAYVSERGWLKKP